MLKRLFLYYLVIIVCQLGQLACQPSYAHLADNSLPSPVAGTVSSPFGWRVDPITGKGRYHSGLDISAPQGTPVLALQPGWVVFTGTYGGYGNLVVLEHAQGLHTWYAHNSVITRQPGEWVNPGETIALVGATGRATGPHLHFEVRVQGQAVDPLQYLAGLNFDLNRVAQAPAPPLPNVRPHWVNPVINAANGTSLSQLAKPPLTRTAMGGPDTSVSVEVLTGGKTVRHSFTRPN